MTDILQHHRGVAIFTFSFTFPYPAPPSRVLSLVNAPRDSYVYPTLWSLLYLYFGFSYMLTPLLALLSCFFVQYHT